MPPQPINSLQEFNDIINSGRIIFLDFWADWCGPCRMISPVFERLADANQSEGIGFYKINVDDVPDVAQQEKIRAMPTFIAYKDGCKVEELVGAHPAGLTNFVNALSNQV